MFSVTYTGKKFFPLWTAKLSPTNSGVMCDRLDHVLIGLRSSVSCALRTFFIREGSTKSIFFWERAMNQDIGRIPILFSGHFSGRELVHWTVSISCEWGNPSKVVPKEMKDARLRMFCLHPLPSGGQRDSWPRRGPLVCDPSSENVQLCLRWRSDVLRYLLPQLSLDNWILQS